MATVRETLSHKKPTSTTNFQIDFLLQFNLKARSADPELLSMNHTFQHHFLTYIDVPVMKYYQVLADLFENCPSVLLIK
jgi:hypothetical protein